MKTLSHLSPSGLALYNKNPEEFYLVYLSDNRPPKFPQTQPMSVGSSFDAYCKSFLHEKLFGKNHKNANLFEFQTIFEVQVEPHNRDWALPAGKQAFEFYKTCGALSDLLIELHQAIGEPRFEIEIKGVIDGHREGITKNLGNVTFLGKPDIFWINKAAAQIQFDWKVNGYCSNYHISPMAGYLRVRGTKPTNHHKDAMPMKHMGMTINGAGYLENYNKDWARQLSIYGWLCGAAIGSETIVAVDQMVGNPDRLRLAEHRLRVSPEHQWQIYAQAEQVWHSSSDGHFFKDRSLEESQAKCRILDKQAEGLSNLNEDDAENFFAKMTRTATRPY